MNIHHRKLLFALLGVFLMTSGVFALIAYIPAGTVGSPQSSPALSNIGETAATSTTVNYWTQAGVANSGTTSFDMPYAENSSQNSVDFSYTPSLNSNNQFSASDGIGYYYYYSYSTITLYSLDVPAIQVSGEDLGTGNPEYGLTVGTVWANISVSSSIPSYSGNSASWSHTFNFNNVQDFGASTGSVEISPSWTLATAYPLTFTLTVAETNDGSGGVSVPTYTVSGSIYTFSGSSSTNQVITTASGPSQAPIGFVTGWKFNSQSTSFTIPQYESSFDVTWSSSSSSNPSYNSQSPSGTSGTLTGSLGSNTITVNPVGDPPDVSNSASTYSFSYYLSSQNQVSTASATQNSNPEPTYTYTQVSGTTNQASASFNFGGSTPSGAVFIPYETTASSLTTTATNIVFLPY